MKTPALLSSTVATLAGFVALAAANAELTAALRGEVIFAVLSSLALLGLAGRDLLRRRAPLALPARPAAAMGRPGLANRPRPHAVRRCSAIVEHAA